MFLSYNSAANTHKKPLDRQAVLPDPSFLEPPIKFEPTT